MIFPWASFNCTFTVAPVDNCELVGKFDTVTVGFSPDLPLNSSAFSVGAFGLTSKLIGSNCFRLSL